MITAIGLGHATTVVAEHWLAAFLESSYGRSGGTGG
jgi:hypothetical protein